MRDKQSQVRGAQGRQLLALLAASGLVLSAWAVFPSFVESRVYVPLPQASGPSGVDVVADPGPGADRGLATQAVFKTMSSTRPPSNVRIGLEGSSRSVVVQLVPLRSKLTALLLLLLQSDDGMRPGLEAKIRALLELPDSALAQLMRHPDLAELSVMLDAVFLGTSNVSQVTTELDKITVTSVPHASERIRVIEVSGRPAYEVRTPVDAEPVAVSVTPLASRLELLAEPTVAPLLPPSLPPPPPPPPPAPEVEQARFAAPALELAPSVEEAPPPPAPPPPPPPPPPAESAERLSEDVMDSGNKFEPGDTTPQPGTGSAPAETEAPTSSASAPEPSGPPEPPNAGATDVNEGPADGGDTAPNGGGPDGDGGQ